MVLRHCIMVVILQKVERIILQYSRMKIFDNKRYGSMTAPVHLGSGGGGTYYATGGNGNYFIILNILNIILYYITYFLTLLPGGGAFRLTSNYLYLDGRISADGGAGGSSTTPADGSGGSVSVLEVFNKYDLTLFRFGSLLNTCMEMVLYLQTVKYLLREVELLYITTKVQCKYNI